MNAFFVVNLLRFWLSLLILIPPERYIILLLKKVGDGEMGRRGVVDVLVKGGDDGVNFLAATNDDFANELYERRVNME